MKTGYPLEIEVSSALDKDWDYVINTATYFDRDESKLRDIDIVAFKNLLTKTPTSETCGFQTFPSQYVKQYK